MLWREGEVVNLACLHAHAPIISKAFWDSSWGQEKEQDLNFKKKQTRIIRVMLIEFLIAVWSVIPELLMLTAMFSPLGVKSVVSATFA